jgi:5'(3')-deoxyribonucleotidase
MQSDLEEAALLAIVRGHSLSIFESNIYGNSTMAIVTTHKDVNVAFVKKAHQNFLLIISFLVLKNNNIVITGNKNIIVDSLNIDSAYRT